MCDKACDPPTWHVVYWVGRAWDDDAEIELRLPTVRESTCIEDSSAVNRLVTGGAKEALSFRLADSDASRCVAGGGFDNGGGVAFAPLENA